MYQKAFASLERYQSDRSIFPRDLDDQAQFIKHFQKLASILFPQQSALFIVSLSLSLVDLLTLSARTSNSIEDGFL
jgi:hypothetical protein